MSATVQKSYRLAPETVERIEQLGQLWGQVRGPLSAARVIDETVARIHHAETKRTAKLPTAGLTPNRTTKTK